MSIVFRIYTCVIHIVVVAVFTASERGGGDVVIVWLFVYVAASSLYFVIV
jgi:hypothetical protein